MGAVIEISGKEADLLRALGRIEKKQAEINKGWKEFEKSSDKAGKEAKKIFEQTRTPMEQHLQRLKKLDDLLKRNKISQDTYNRAVGQSERAMRGATGPNMLNSLASLATRWLSVGAAASSVLAVMRQIEQTQIEAAERARGAEPGMRELAQLAGGDPQKLRTLVKQTRRLYRGGGAATLEEAGGTVFALQSGGLAGDLDLFTRAGRISRDPRLLAQSVGVLRAAVGQKEAGTSGEILSKGLAAARPAAGANLAQVMAATAQAASMAKGFDVRDEELMTMVSLLSEYMSAGEAGTRVGGFFTALRRQGFADRFKGRPVVEMIRQVQRRARTQKKQIEFFGRVQAQEAFAAAAQPGVFERRLGEIDEAARSGLVERVIGSTEAVPEIAVPQRRQRAQAARELSEYRLGLQKLKTQELRDINVTAMRAAGASEFIIGAQQFEAPILDFFLPANMERGLTELIMGRMAQHYGPAYQESVREQITEAIHGANAAEIRE